LLLGALAVGAPLAPTVFAVGVGLLVPLQLVIVFLVGSQRAQAPHLVVLRRELRIEREHAAAADYRTRERAGVRVVVDGNDLGDEVEQVVVTSQSDPHSGTRRYSIYLQAAKRVVEVTHTWEADAARDLRQQLRKALGLAQAGGAPQLERDPFSRSSWLVLVLLIHVVAATPLVALPFSAVVSDSLGRWFAFAVAALGLALLELCASLALGRLLRPVMWAWLERQFTLRE
jgi:hypothetical protein